MAALQCDYLSIDDWSCLFNARLYTIDDIDSGWKINEFAFWWLDTFFCNQQPGGRINGNIGSGIRTERDTVAAVQRAHTAIGMLHKVDVVAADRGAICIHTDERVALIIIGNGDAPGEDKVKLEVGNRVGIIQIDGEFDILTALNRIDVWRNQSVVGGSPCGHGGQWVFQNRIKNLTNE